MPIYKIKAGRIITVPVTEYVADEGTLFYDETLGNLRIGDGVTPGGRLITNGVGTGGTGTITVSEINGASTITNEVTVVTAIRFDQDTGFNVEDLGDGEVKVSLGSVIGSNWRTWNVAGQDSLIADGDDTIQFVAGNGMNIVTSATNKTITFDSTLDFVNLDGGDAFSNYGGLEILDAGGI